MSKSTLGFLDLPKITQYFPNHLMDKTLLEISQNIKLADPNFYYPSEIDALLGAEIFYRLLYIGQIWLPKSVVLQKTQLGWIISERVITNKQRSIVCQLSTDSLQMQISKFWEIEEKKSSSAHVD